MFTFLTVRVAFLLITVLSFSTMVTTAIVSSQPSFDPFASYADILPGQSLENVLAHGFSCRVNGSPFYKKSCLLNPETDTFSEIWVSISSETGLVSRVVFIPRESALLLGHLASLWGKPQTIIFGRYVNFRWPAMHALFVPRNYNGHYSYWMPITYVAFDSAI